jgi:anti-sigma regulatory factor (Ser/Thr protein kinase)
VTGAPAHRTRFHHEAFFYAGEDEFLAGVIPFLEEGLEGGETVLAILPDARLRLLRDALGATAEDIELQPMEETGRNPARLISAWRDVLRSAAPDKNVRGLGEPAWPGRGSPELDECERHERLLNLAFDQNPMLTLMCPYDTGALDEEVLAAARRSHPQCGDVCGRAASRDYDLGDPLTGSLPLPRIPTATLGFGRTDLPTVRHAVADLARTAGLIGRRNEDLVLAVSEIATNSVQHGGGEGSLAIWRDDGQLICDLRDAGRIEDPLVGRQRPAATQVGGRGIWIAHQLCDLVQVRSGERGTQVRLRMSIKS